MPLPIVYDGLFGLQVGDLLVQLFFFIVLLVLLRKFAWGPIVDMMQKREEHVANEIDEAEKNREEAQKLFDDAQTQLKEVKQEAQTIINDAKQSGVKQQEDIVATARLEADRIKKSAQQDIQSEKEKALQALQDKVASLSVLIASKVIEKDIDSADQEKLINDYIKEAGEEQ